MSSVYVTAFLIGSSGLCFFFLLFFFSSRRRHTRCALVTGVQTCALPIFGVAGTELNAQERDWLQHDACAGVILFKRNFASRTQVAELSRSEERRVGKECVQYV